MAKFSNLFFLFVFIVFIIGCRNKTETENNPNVRITKEELGIQNLYNKTQIGKQIWFTSDLRVKTFQNGDSILEVTTAKGWVDAINSKMPAYKKFREGGRESFLYNWFAVNDPRNLAPKGYHIATDTDWTELMNNIGSDTISRNININNLFKKDAFNVIVTPSGRTTKTTRRAEFQEFRGWGLPYWSTTELSEEDVWCHLIVIESNEDYRLALSKSYGMSVRCLKDSIN